MQHLVVKLGPSRESTAKSRQVLTLILEGPHMLESFQRDEAVALVGATFYLTSSRRAGAFLVVIFWLHREQHSESHIKG